jgi:hypothetical protein
MLGHTCQCPRVQSLPECKTIVHREAKQLCTDRRQVDHVHHMGHMQRIVRSKHAFGLLCLWTGDRGPRGPGLNSLNKSVHTRAENSRQCILTEVAMRK